MIEITFLKLGHHVLQVPPGLSELVTDCWTKEKETRQLGYDREIVKKSNQLVTILRKRKER